MKKSAIENQINEKLNAREITPSKASWDRLDAMLSVAEKPKPKSRWMYVAASLVGFLLLGTLYFNQNNKETVVAKDTIVVQEPKVIPQISSEPVKINLIQESGTNKIVERQIAPSEIKPQIDSNIVLSNNEIPVAEKEIIQKEPMPIITRGFADRLERSGENQKTGQSIQLQKSKYVNADELLASVDNASPKVNSLPVKSNVKVNSNELLTQVDGELDLSFREKALKAVNQNFKAVKLALSNRNSK